MARRCRTEACHICHHQCELQYELVYVSLRLKEETSTECLVLQQVSPSTEAKTGEEATLAKAATHAGHASKRGQGKVMPLSLRIS